MELIFIVLQLPDQPKTPLPGIVLASGGWRSGRTGGLESPGPADSGCNSGATIVLNVRYVDLPAPPGPATTEPPREQVLAAAIDCFGRHGYRGASIDRVAREAGLTKGALYYHFRDKEALLFAAVTERIGELECKVVRDVEPARDAFATLRRVVDNCFFHATVSNHRRFIITTALMVEALDTNPRLSDEFRRILRGMRAFLPQVVRRGHRAGTIRGDVEPEAVTAALAGGIVGAELQHYQDPEQIDLRAVFDTLVEQRADWLATRGRPAAAAPPRGRGAKPAA